MEGAKQNGDPRCDEERTSDEAKQRHAAWHEAGPIHEVAQYQTVPDTGAKEAGTEKEGPIMDRDERPPDDDERDRIRARGRVPEAL